MFSAFPFNEVEINQINGKIESKETNIKTVCMEIFSINFFIFYPLAKCYIYSFQNRIYL